MIYAKDGYILCVSDKELDEKSLTILEIVKNKPIPPIGYDYRLKEDLTWELYEVAKSQEITQEEKERLEREWGDEMEVM